MFEVIITQVGFGYSYGDTVNFEFDNYEEAMQFYALADKYVVKEGNKRVSIQMRMALEKKYEAEAEPAN